AVEVTNALCPAGSTESRRGGGRVAPAIRPRELRGSGADTIWCMSDQGERLTVLVYSNSASVRAQVRTAVGRRPAPEIGRIDWVECATNAEVVGQLDEGQLDVVILDGEA